MKALHSAMGAAALLALAHAAPAAAPAALHLVLKDHRFTPDRLVIRAGERVRIELVNEDAALEEFDSGDLHVEKDVTPHGRVTFEIGPLKPGTYSFMGELHPDTASGAIVAQPEN